MKKLLLLLLLIIASCSVEDPIDYYADCAPVLEKIQKTPSEGYIELDILPHVPKLNKGFVTNKWYELWPNAEVPYYYQKEDRTGKYTILGFNEEYQFWYDYYIQEIQLATGVLFHKYESKEDLLQAFSPNYPNAIVIKPSFLGSSHLGMQGNIQALNLTYTGFDSEEERKRMAHLVYHEFGHALGLHHEFTRPDRDRYIKINWDNIPEGLKDQLEAREGTVCGKGYDYESPMNYATYGWGYDEEVWNIRTLENRDFEKDLPMSEGYIKTIRSLYSNQKK